MGEGGGGRGWRFLNSSPKLRPPILSPKAHLAFFRFQILVVKIDTI
jgi:hypothetical protein